MAKAAVLGFPRMGKNRELKKALEQYWKGETGQEELLAVAGNLRASHWRLMKARNIDVIPSNDFSLYDQVLDTTCMAGAVPDRYDWRNGDIGLELYFAMARGRKCGWQNIPALEMTKWFDTNYHFLAPEFKSNQAFELYSLKAVREFEEAKALGIHTRPVLLGPVTYLLLGRMSSGQGSALGLLSRLLPVYEEMLARLAEAGADWVQMDEPCLALDRDPDIAARLAETYQRLSTVNPDLKIQLTAYFGGITQYLDVLDNCPAAGWHIDLIRAPGQLDAVLEAVGPGRQLSLGVIDGRNIWRTDFTKILPMICKASARLGSDNIQICSTCSLLHVPFSLEGESALDPEIKNWMSFADEKLTEIELLNRWINLGPKAVADEVTAHQAYIQIRRTSKKVHNPHLGERYAEVPECILARQRVFAQRKKRQKETLGLPLLPTTTIGSFPQTREIRIKRKEMKDGNISASEYEQFLKNEMRRCIAAQEQIGLDVLVHGEFERNDMVEYFGEQLDGFAFTQNGWVQSYGSRCVKPPIIYGDVERRGPMTVKWSRFAQSLTPKPMKGMLTGPVTILQWSFVRDDQPRLETCEQIALALRDEVLDLETAGIKIIQIDEPALREGLPLVREEREEYLRWSVNCFRLAVLGVKDETQIHTHMCYGDFKDILPAIAELDADVISIEASRSGMRLLKIFGDYEYPNDIGPGVYDIHSPLIPDVKDIVGIVREAMTVIPPERLWINPDCGLKTRDWPEVKAALWNMVESAKILREELDRSGCQPSPARR